VNRFKDSKHFTSYLRSAPRVANSNTSPSTSIRGTNKKGRARAHAPLPATLLTRSLNHVLKAGPKPDERYRLLTQYKKPGLVRTSLRRRVDAELYQMPRKQEYHYGREALKHERKMLEYKKLKELRFF
jgi:hypothetical protein